jgi:uncharacterized protein
MSALLDDIFVLPVGGKRLVFSPRRNVAAVVSAATVPWLTAALAGRPGRRGRKAEAAPEAQELADALRAEPAQVPRRTGPPSPIFLGLIVTRRCNMACRYCDFGSADGADASMSPTMAAAAVDAWVGHLRKLGQDYLDLRFFGGEPFIMEDVVETAVLRTRALAAAHGMRAHVEASTNGVMSRRMLGFVRDHFDAVVLSLDGMREDHDLHRPAPHGGSAFDEVCRAAGVLSGSPVDLSLRCCVSAANVRRMPRIAEWFARTFRPAAIDFEPLSATDESAAAALAEPDPLVFAGQFILARRVLRAEGLTCVYSPLFESPRHTFCPLGQDAFIVSPAGSVRSCYLRKRRWLDKGLDLEIGSLSPQGELSIDDSAVQRLRDQVADRARCRRCFCRWGCAGGCLVRETFPGHAPGYSAWCVQTRLIQACVLLEDMGLGDLADAMLADGQATQAVARQADDTLEGQCK